MILDWNVSFSPDGNLLATAAPEEGVVLIWNVSGPQEPRILASPGSRIHAAAFSADGSKLAATGSDGRVYVWRAPEWQGTAILGEASVGDLIGAPSAITRAIALSP